MNEYVEFYLMKQKNKLIEENRKLKEKIIAITAKADKLRNIYNENLSAMNQIQREIDGLI